MNDIEITLPSIEEAYGDKNGKNRLSVIDNSWKNCLITDLAILTGGNVEDLSEYKEWYFWTKSFNNKRPCCVFNQLNYTDYRGCCVIDPFNRIMIIRPLLLLPDDLFKQLSTYSTKLNSKVDVVDFGEYPQFATSVELQKELTKEFENNKLNRTGKTYTFDMCQYDDYGTRFKPFTYYEYEYKGKKYICVRMNNKVNRLFDIFNKNMLLSNNHKYSNGDFVWVEVTPLTWLLDKEKKLLISKNGLLYGIRFGMQGCIDYKKSEIFMYLHKYLLPEIMQNINLNNFLTFSDENFSFFENMLKDISVEDREEYLAALNKLKNESNKVRK